MGQKQQISIYWLRRDLRLEDNIALTQALDGKYPVLPVFIFDAHILSALDDPNDPRVTFIYNTLAKLKKQLEDYDSTLHVFYGQPEEIFQSLFNQYNIKVIYVNRDYEPYALQRDASIRFLANVAGSAFYSFKDHVIFEADEVLKQDGTAFRVFTPFKRAWLERYNTHEGRMTSSQIDFGKLLKSQPATMPTLASMGFTESKIHIPPAIPDKTIIRNYDKTRDYPALHGTTRLGIHLRFGTVSIRTMMQLAAMENGVWQNELIWREFYSYILQHFPYVANRAFNKKYDRIPWLNDEQSFKKWSAGQTGYPIVDAGMRELNATGYMHNRVRMIAASFLTKHLLIDWRWGEAYFASKLLDYELASNNGGWQWAAGTGTDAQPWFRIFNPTTQAEKFDPKNEYIQRWVPEFGSAAYANPIVEHKMARARALTVYKKSVL